MVPEGVRAQLCIRSQFQVLVTTAAWFQMEKGAWTGKGSFALNEATQALIAEATQTSPN